ncbi:MAG: T9SS type A sorting domain-containing protein [Bacteroidales bacterium]|nr:T9SS type A sorting domain-containing protein [Bacteroidales bacterium]
MKSMIAFLVLFLLVFEGILAQDSRKPNTDKILVRIFVDKTGDLNPLDNILIETVNRVINEYADVIIYHDDLALINNRGFKYEILDYCHREFLVDPEYHTYEEMLDVMNDFANDYPEISLLDTLGTSQEMDLYILSLKISDNPAMEEDEPAVLYDGLHHAREPVSTETCLVIIDYLLSNYETDPVVEEWINNTEIFIIPMLNPDGWKYIVDDSLGDPWWRKNLRDNDSSGNFDPLFDGVDLNRNYDHCWSNGISDPSDWLYRGSAPFSENETKAKRDLALEQKFVMSITYHTYSEMVFYPHSMYGIPNPDQELYTELATHLGSLIPRFNGMGTYLPLATVCEDGSSNCWMYYTQGTLEFTVEEAHMFIPPGEDALSIANDNLQGALFLLDRIKGPGITGYITDAGSGNPLEAVVKIFELDDTLITPRTSDEMYGRYTRLLLPGTYTVEVSKTGYQTDTVSNVTVGDENITVLDIQLQSTANTEEYLASGSGNLILFPATPNPFSGSTKLRFQITHQGNVECNLYNFTGAVVCQLLNEDKLPGIHEFEIEGRDLKPGIYFCTLKTNNGIQTKKIIKF